MFCLTESQETLCEGITAPMLVHGRLQLLWAAVQRQARPPFKGMPPKSGLQERTAPQACPVQLPKKQNTLKKQDFMSAAFSKLIWRKCTVKFLQDVDF